MNIKTTKQNALRIASYLISGGCIVLIEPVGEMYKLRVMAITR